MTPRRKHTPPPPPAIEAEFAELDAIDAKAEADRPRIEELVAENLLLRTHIGTLIRENDDLRKALARRRL